MLDRSQWIAIGLVSGFAYILGKDRESFEAPYSGSGSLMGIKQDTSIGDFSAKELTESSAIHGDFNEASLNYSGHQNIQVRGSESFEAEVKLYGISGDVKIESTVRRILADINEGQGFADDEYYYLTEEERDEAYDDMEFDAESFEAHESIYAGDAGDILEIKLVSPARGELIWTPEENEFAEFIISYEGRRRECSIVSDSIYNNLVGKSLVCDRNNHTISGKTKESGFPVTVTFGNIPTFNRICSMIEDKFNAESFEAEKKNCGCGQDPCVTYGAEPYEGESFGAEYTLTEMANKSFRDIDKISGFVADRLNHTQESWANLTLLERKEALYKIRQDEDLDYLYDGGFDDGETTILTKKQLKKYLDENYSSEDNIEIDNGYIAKHKNVWDVEYLVVKELDYDEEGYLYDAESFEADGDNFAEIENLLDSNDDIFLGTGDGFKPDHPNREEIIAYLTQGGGGQTPYRVCFTCSRVTPDWVTIDEGYECIPCADQ